MCSYLLHVGLSITCIIVVVIVIIIYCRFVFFVWNLCGFLIVDKGLFVGGGKACGCVTLYIPVCTILALLHLVVFFNSTALRPYSLNTTKSCFIYPILVQYFSFYP